MARSRSSSRAISVRRATSSSSIPSRVVPAARPSPARARSGVATAPAAADGAGTVHQQHDRHRDCRRDQRRQHDLHFRCLLVPAPGAGLVLASSKRCGSTAARHQTSSPSFTRTTSARARLHLWTLPDTPSGWIPFGSQGKAVQNGSICSSFGLAGGRADRVHRRVTLYPDARKRRDAGTRRGTRIGCVILNRCLRRRQPSACAGWSSASGPSPPSTGSTSTCPRAPASACWGRTGRASRPRCGCSPRRRSPTRATLSALGYELPRDSKQARAEMRRRAAARQPRHRAHRAAEPGGVRPPLPGAARGARAPRRARPRDRQAHGPGRHARRRALRAACAAGC